jgi:fatty acid desaturase/membrane-associated phospholipid phosphatase
MLASRAPRFAPIVLSPGAFDDLIPLVPPAAFVYATYFLLLPVLIAVGARRDGFGDVLTSALGCGLSNAIVYNLVPTRIAERRPAPPGSLLALVQRVDTPLCAIPSGHVALPAVVAAAALLVSRRVTHAHTATFWRRVAAGFALWTVALAVSTLLTKQHYVVDVVWGLAFGIGVAACGVRAARAAARGVLHLPTVAALVLEWCAIVAAVAVAMRWWSPPIVVAAALVVATRQHALMALYHDGVHALVARSRRVNDFIINQTIGVPVLLPLHIYRELHLSHHRHLGEECDPERVLLYRGQPWQYRPLRTMALVRQIAGDVSGWYAVKTVIRYFRERRDGSALKLRAIRAYPELAVQFVVFYGAAAAAFVMWPAETARAAALWFVPYVTLTQLLQKIRSFAEHGTAAAKPSLSCSWSPGLLGRLTIWPYNINYHHEHHAHPAIPWDRLPSASPSPARRRGWELRAHLWNGAFR